MRSEAKSMNVIPNAVRSSGVGKQPMIDLIFIATAIGFFALAIAYTHGCEKLRGGNHD
jgi:hypothetical protein